MVPHFPELPEDALGSRSDRKARVKSDTEREKKKYKRVFKQFTESRDEVGQRHGEKRRDEKYIKGSNFPGSPKQRRHGGEHRGTTKIRAGEDNLSVLLLPSG